MTQYHNHQNKECKQIVAETEIIGNTVNICSPQDDIQIYNVRVWIFLFF